MRCDLHVHTVHSGHCTLPGLRRVCRESYSPPGELYRRLRQRGMDLVTVTDHDSIAAADDLGGRFDFFLSEEVTCRLPSGTEAHLGVYDITPGQHVQIQARRDDLPRLGAYLREQRIFTAVNHIGSALTGRRRMDDYTWLAAVAAGFETRNGHVPPRNNALAESLARYWNKIALGGSDSHSLRGAGRTWTRVPGARNREEFLRGLRAGRGIPEGEHGSAWKLAAGIFDVSRGMTVASPATWLLMPLASLIPLVALGNDLAELGWARYWSARLRRHARSLPAPANTTADFDTVGAA